MVMGTQVQSMQDVRQVLKGWTAESVAEIIPWLPNDLDNRLYELGDNPAWLEMLSTEECYTIAALVMRWNSETNYGAW